MSNVQQRLAKLEKQGRVLAPTEIGIRQVDYRAGLLPGVTEPADSIPVIWIDYEDLDHETTEPTSET